MTEQRSNPFPLRLPRTTRAEAHDLARQLGLSLNEFILNAIAEKVARVEPLLLTSPSASREES